MKLSSRPAAAVPGGDVAFAKSLLSRLTIANLEPQSRSESSQVVDQMLRREND